MPEAAPGIPDRSDYGDISKLRTRMLLDYVLQKHMAKRRGLHYDFRLGDKEKGMYSWAMNQPLPAEGEKTTATRTHLHSHDYNDFEGEIPEGYGAGTVSQAAKGRALLTGKSDNVMTFSTADKRHPERYAMIHPGGKYPERYWQMLRQRMPDHPGAEKQKLAPLSEQKLLKIFDNMPERTVVQPKIDGALQFLNLSREHPELLSHRYSRQTGKPVVHTERFFGERPKLDLPPLYRNSVLMAEVYGSRNGRPVRSQETSGLLNSTIENSLKSQQATDTELKGMLFDVAKLGGKDVSTLPYTEKKRLMAELIPMLPAGKFHLPEEATNRQEALRMWKAIKSHAHDQTVEGVVVRPDEGPAMKAKVFPEQDVYIRDFFPGQGKYTDKGVGGFSYSHQPDSPVVGKVGTGLTDEMRSMMYKDPKTFLGRVAKVRSHGQQASGALRVPSFQGLHEDY